MALLIASDLHKDIAGQPLLHGVSLKLERRERLTVAGRNGAGKTTLLRMLAGETSIDRGELSIGKGVRIALHDQRPPREREMALRDYLLSGCAEELQIEAQLAELEASMAAGASDEATFARYARAQARLEARGGYLWRNRATAMAHGLGFRESDLDRPLDTFSGGQLTRASLARALATGADVLLLDEPTNHLDIESLEWLEQTLVELDAAVVLVAHDRWFLEAVGTAVLELYGSMPARSRFFAGTWHQWRREQAAREIALGKAIDSQQAEIERMERFIERFRYKATKAKQAQSRVKKLAKIERIERDPADGKGLEFSFSAPERTGRVIFELLDGRIEVGGDATEGGADGVARDPIVLLEHVELWLERGEHVSLVGPNGTGKTTLIETLAGRRALGAGKLSTGHNVKVGYLSQHADELGAGGLADAERAGCSPARNRADPGQGPRPARTLPVLRRGRRETAQRAVRRRAAAPVAGGAGPLRRQRADPGRAHQPPGHRESRGAGGCAARVHGGDPACVSRPRAAGRGRHAHDRRRAAVAAQLRGRLAGVRARARRATRRGRRQARPGARRGRRRGGRLLGWRERDSERRGKRVARAGRARRGDGGQREARAGPGEEGQAESDGQGAVEEPAERAAEGRARGRAGGGDPARGGSGADRPGGMGDAL